MALSGQAGELQYCYYTTAQDLYESNISIIWNPTNLFPECTDELPSDYLNSICYRQWGYTSCKKVSTLPGACRNDFWKDTGCTNSTLLVRDTCKKSCDPKCGGIRDDLFVTKSPTFLLKIYKVSRKELLTLKHFSKPLGMPQGSGNDGSNYGVSGSKLSESIKTYSGPTSKCKSKIQFIHFAQVIFYVITMSQ